jgi:hypothetical protein
MQWLPKRHENEPQNILKFPATSFSSHWAPVYQKDWCVTVLYIFTYYKSVYSIYNFKMYLT